MIIRIDGVETPGKVVTVEYTADELAEQVAEKIGLEAPVTVREKMTGCLVRLTVGGVSSCQHGPNAIIKPEDVETLLKSKECTIASLNDGYFAEAQKKALVQSTGKSKIIRV